MHRRNIEQHIALYAAFADALSELQSLSWERLIRHGASMDGDSMRTVLQRARLRAKASNILSGTYPQSRVVRGIAVGSSVAITAMHVAFDLIGEFDEAESPKNSSCAVPPRPPEDPLHRKHFDAFCTIVSALETSAPSHRGVSAAVHAASDAIIHHDWIPTETFSEVYAFMEAEIPFESVERRAKGE